MKKSFLKIIFLLLIISLSWFGLSGIGETWANFSDNEISSGNTFTAATLDFSWTSPGDFSPSVTPKQSSSRDITINKIGSLDFQYNGSVVKTGGSDAVCDALHLEAKLEGATKHDDGLLDFNITPKVIIGGDGQDAWTFIVTLISIDPSLEGQSCNFNIVFNAEQLGSPGFSDQEVVPSIITVGSSTSWTQTPQGDFESGVLTGVDTTTSPGDVMLTGAYSIDNNTVALWHLNEGSGSIAYDATTNDNDGTINGAGWTLGKYNNALGLDGVNDFVVVNDSGSLKPARVTLEAWVKKAGTPGTFKYIAAKYYSGSYASYALYTGSSGGLRFYIGHSGGFVASPDAGTGVWDGNWHHIVGTYDGSKVRLYIDGAEVGTGTATAVSIAYNTNKFYIGSYGSGFYFGGVIDEIRISNIARTSFPVSYFNSGTLESQGFDSGGMTRWQSLEWDETLPSANTDITLEVATSNDDSTWSPWQLSSNDVSIGIDLTSLPETRYIKWKATLTTSDTGQTPVLHEVRVQYYPGAASEHIVLNEFLPNPSGIDPGYGFDFGEDGDSQPKGEWVEFYNKEGGSAVDLAGWYIKDKDGNTKSITTSNTDTGSTVIGAHGSGNEWLVVYMNEEMLDNDGDTIELYDVFDNLIDSYSYDLSGFCALEPTPGDSNDETASGDCPSEVPGNKSYARIPDGSDDWVDPVPTPGGPNRVEESNSDEVTPIYPVINEVYYHVGEDKGFDSGNEWVEVYNKADKAIDISGWKICDDDSCDVLPASEPIPAGGFGVITAESNTWDFWPSIPSETVKILLGNSIGDGLNNEGDRVVLQKPDGTRVDAVSYGIDDYAFFPSCPAVARGYSLARDPKGEDTDQASDFVELSTPSPGENFPSPEDEEEVDEALVIDKESSEGTKEATESGKRQDENGDTEDAGSGKEEDEEVGGTAEMDEDKGKKKEEGESERGGESLEAVPPEDKEESVEEDGEEGDDLEREPQGESQPEEQSREENPEEATGEPNE